MEQLEGWWAQVWKMLAVPMPARMVFEQLSAAYTEPHRHYHSTQHLEECLDSWVRHQTLAERPGEVGLALFFHDAVYATGRKDNEARSADWARSVVLDAGGSEDAADRIHGLIMATCHTAEPETPDQALLVDIDLSILGAEPRRFEQYEAQIRAEYAWVPGFLYRRKRRAILKGFFDRERLFTTEVFHEALEEKARTNLKRTLGLT